MGVDAMAITKVDTLSGLESLKVAVAYETPAGKPMAFPADVDEFESIRPVYEDLPGFEGDLSGIRNRGDLPSEAQNYLAFIEKQVGVPLKLISVGKERDQVILP